MPASVDSAGITGLGTCATQGNRSHPVMKASNHKAKAAQETVQ